MKTRLKSLLQEREFDLDLIRSSESRICGLNAAIDELLDQLWKGDSRGATRFVLIDGTLHRFSLRSAGWEYEGAEAYADLTTENPE